MKTYRPIVFTLVLIGLIGMRAQQTHGADRPNVIIVLTDDQGYGDVASHGNPVIKTPNIDRLRAESVRLTDFHVAPMCSPTRGQLLTGRDAMKNGCTAVCQGRSMMREDLPTLPDFFAKAGYVTGHFGKWHLGDSYPHRPQDRGFGHTLHHRAWGITSLADYWKNDYFNPVLNINGEDKRYEGYSTDIFFDQAIKWIDKQQAANEPFFAYIPTNTPHVPDTVKESDAAPYRAIGSYQGKKVHAEFYGQISNIDQNMAKLEQFLKAKGLRDNTILIYMADNGTRSKLAQQIYNAGMRGKKTEVYEGGHRVLCYTRWPNGGLRHGADINQLTEVQDLLPTLAEFCDVDTGTTELDGVSLAGLMRGTQKKLADRKLVVQYRVSGEKWDPAVVMWNKWRLTNPNELYDLRNDPGQQTNVAAKNPKIVKAMSDHYDQWHKQARPLFEIPRIITLGSNNANPMMLYANDWTGGYCDNGGNLIQANTTGYYEVDVAKAGVYQFELRRWAFEANLPLAGPGTGHPKYEGRGARPIAQANLKIADFDESQTLAPNATNAKFSVKLKAGRTQLTPLFMDANGQDVCGAIYVKVTRTPE